MYIYIHIYIYTYMIYIHICVYISIYRSAKEEDSLPLHTCRRSLLVSS